MASYMRNMFSQAATRTSGTPPNSEEAEKYRLLVTAGPSYDLKDHQIVHVNTDNPVYIENEFVRAKINVRVRDFRGLPSSCPSNSDYFDDPIHEKDQYSLGFSFVPKKDLPSVSTVWGNDLDHPVRERLPPGFNTAFRIAKEFIDPGLSCDVYADEPWIYGPSLSCWFAFRVGDTVAQGTDFEAPGILTEGGDGSGREVRYKYNLPENNEKRRRFFLQASNREPFVFEKDRLYQGDFYNPYISFSQFSLRLPGFSLKVLKYIGEKTHCLRYVFKNRDTGEVYFNVNFTLLWGEQLKKAIKEDEQHLLQAVAGAVANGDAVSGAEESDGSGNEAERSTKGGEMLATNGESEPKSATNGNSVPATDGHTVPDTMQLHPGDHEAAAEKMVEVNGVNEISEMLKNTSTCQHKGGTLLSDN